MSRCDKCGQITWWGCGCCEWNWADYIELLFWSATGTMLGYTLIQGPKNRNQLRYRLEKEHEYNCKITRFVLEEQLLEEEKEKEK